MFYIAGKSATASKSKNNTNRFGSGTKTLTEDILYLSQLERGADLVVTMLDGRPRGFGLTSTHDKNIRLC